MASSAPALFRKVALVTGSTQGIGWGILQQLAKSGASVMMHGVSKGPEHEADLRTKLQELQQQHGCETAELYTHDLRKPAEIRRLIHEVSSQHGPIDILVNNAGVQHVAPVVDFPEEQWDNVINIILNATFHATKAALPSMIDRGWGRVINTGSMHAVVASPYKSAYNAAKHGVAGFTKTVALETATTGVTCNAVCPGYALTDLVKNQLQDTAKVRGMPVEKVITDVMLADQPTKQFVDPLDIGALVAFLCTPEAKSITGACLSIDGGWTCR